MQIQNTVLINQQWVEKRQMTSAEQGQPGNFKLNKASTSNGSAMSLFDSPTTSSDEPKAFISITLTASTNKIVLTAVLSPLSSITKKSQIMGDLLDLIQKRLQPLHIRQIRGKKAEGQSC
jgi:hypothetical protein